MSEQVAEYYAGTSAFEAHPDPHEEEVLRALFTCNTALMSALREEYGEERGWSVCGPDSILRARFCSAITGVPFRPGGSDEHLEIMLVLKPLPGHRAVEHAVVQYVMGSRDEVFFFDGTGELQWGRNIDQDSALGIMIGYRSAPNEALLSENYSLLTARKAFHFGVDVWGDGVPQSAITIADHVAIMHQDQVFSDYVTGPSGEAYDVSSYWGKRLVRDAEKTRSRSPNGVIDSLDRVLTLEHRSELEVSIN